MGCMEMWPTSGSGLTPLLRITEGQNSVPSGLILILNNQYKLAEILIVTVGQINLFFQVT